MWEPLVPVAAVLALFAFLAWRFPVLLRMGVRNIGRRKAQSAIVVAGLMVGTAIISGSFVTADSLEYGITRATYDALGPTDHFVHLESNLFFPQEAYERLAANETLTRQVHGLAPYFVDTAAIRNPEARLSEPGIAVIGFDPEAERRFEPFVLRDGTVTYGDELGPNDIFIAGAVADKIDAKVGDTLRLSYSIIPQPLLPRIHNVTGTVLGASGCTAPLP
ncbi:MAG TPA: hypothetical protein VNZ52_00560, partial [Candidatus Thermoplasmatota archaeon]|nr:hypothetical protein [Candidatus Thermoplasmatota archaeon]